MKWLALCVLAVVFVTLAVADGEIWEEDDHEILIRSERGAKNRGKRKFDIVFVYIFVVNVLIIDKSCQFLSVTCDDSTCFALHTFNPNAIKHGREN